MISIKILGSECKKCRQLEMNARKVVEEKGIDASVEKVTDFQEIIKYGVVHIPALVINEKVESIGIVLKSDAIIKLLEKWSN